MNSFMGNRKKNVNIKKMKTSKLLSPIISFVFVLLIIINPNFQFGNSYQTEFNLDPNKSPKSANLSLDLTNNTDLEAFMDQILLEQLQSYNIAGATLSIVKNDTILLSKGYGYANIGAIRQVNPETTLFKVASISKSFVATAVMILVENDSLDLNTNVNDYLNAFKIRNTFPNPITLAHLLSHTAGFEENFAPITVFTDENLPNLEEILIEEMPNRIWPVGYTSAYSNWGFALAGYIVEIVSGMPFDVFVDEFIFQPLGMQYSSFQQSLPNSLRNLHSYGYIYGESAGYQPGLLEILTIPPAGGLSSTANDMAIFMMMLLQGGKVNGSQIITNNTIQDMWNPYFQSHPSMPGIGMGFYEMIINNKTIKTHEGDSIYFTSQMALIPDEKIGIFISYNTRTALEPRKELLERFMDQYFPKPQISLTPIPNFQDRAKIFAGEYLKTRTNFATVEKFQLLSDLPYKVIQVNVNPNGTLQIDGKTYIEIEPMLFHDVNNDSNHVYTFTKNENGQIIYLYDGDFCPTSYKRLDWYEKPSFFEPVLWSSIIFLIISFMIFFLLGIIEIIKKLIKSIKSKKSGDSGDSGDSEKSGKSTLQAILGPSIILIMLISFTLPFILMPSAINIRYTIYNQIEGILDYLTIQNRYYDEIIPILTLPLIFVIFTCIASIFTIIIWKNFRKNSVKKKSAAFENIYYTFIVSIGWFLVWFLNYWNAIGFKL